MIIHYSTRHLQLRNMFVYTRAKVKAHRSRSFGAPCTLVAISFVQTKYVDVFATLPDLPNVCIIPFVNWVLKQHIQPY